MYKKYIKRCLDFTIALISIIIFSPVLITVFILVKIKLGSPVIFKQQRPGRGEKIFTMYKFRTMIDEKDSEGNYLPDEKRLTKFGKILRSTSLDELPELFNILKGDMSIVGPRPQLIKDMMFMTPQQRKRHSVRQGLTGLAQVSGRNNISWEKKIEYDLEYIENITFLGDLKIVFKTFKKVFKRADIINEEININEDFGDYLLRIGKISQLEYNEKINLSKNLEIKDAG